MSLFGVNLPGSPFELYAFAPRAHAPNCEVQGEALSQANARLRNVFEIRFRDKLGQDAEPVELDVFGELLVASGRPSMAEAHNDKSHGHKGKKPLSTAQGFQWAPSNYVASLARANSQAAASPSLSSPNHSPSHSPEASRRTHRQGPRVTKLRTKEAKLLMSMHATERINDTTMSERAISQLPDSVKKGASPGSKSINGRASRNSSSNSLTDRQMSQDTDRQRLAITKRQQHLQMWSRREAMDKNLLTNEKGVATSRGLWYAMRVLPWCMHAEPRLPTDTARQTLIIVVCALCCRGSREKSAYLHELDTDPTGFAFGGVKPKPTKGKKGVVSSVHQVSYSVGLAGTYLLHVRLREEGLPVPGSPFRLAVHPGPPVAHASFVATDVHSFVSGKMGVAVWACDMMGNVCAAGAANFSCFCPQSDDMSIVVKDVHDGSYQLEWLAQVGKCEMHIQLSGTHIVGSPLCFEVVATNSPEHKGKAVSDKKGNAPGRHGKQPNPALTLTVPREPVMSTRRRMSVGLSGLQLPVGIAFYNMNATVQHEEQDEAAAKMQALIRGRQQRQRQGAKGFATLANVRPPGSVSTAGVGAAKIVTINSGTFSAAEDKAAARVQALLRGRNVRKHRNGTKSTNRPVVSASFATATTKSAAARVAASRDAPVETSSDKVKAATKVQAMLRGRSVRNHKPGAKSNVMGADAVATSNLGAKPGATNPEVEKPEAGKAEVLKTDVHFRHSLEAAAPAGSSPASTLRRMNTGGFESRPGARKPFGFARTVVEEPVVEEEENYSDEEFDTGAASVYSSASLDHSLLAKGDETDDSDEEEERKSAADGKDAGCIVS